ncbi:class II fructose-bisphosphate aldolase [Fodinicola acaciae]|uniref:class II fructose-bisphosphate aldolase n=1 Tax=Fodinicola acaciae TaxID=2681555 RepID=UPI0013D03A35|nr:class II fructose-bisphosphate aldolase [Fodinicola acaciae]
MPVADPETYREMLDRAKSGGYAYPAINVTSSETLNAALRGFAEAGSDGIIQITVGSGEFWSGDSIRDAVGGAVTFAECARSVARNYPVTVALHTDHCPKEKYEGFLLPLLAESRQRHAAAGGPLFQSHMWDGSALPLEENLAISARLLALAAEVDAILEVEIGVVGEENAGLSGITEEKQLSTPEDADRVVDVLGMGERGRYLLAASFGNVHGVYRPGNVSLQPKVLEVIQRHIAERTGIESPFDLVFHGGSGSDPTAIEEAVSYGVVKMNIDTDTMYAFSRAVAHHVLSNYDKVLRVDGEMGSKKHYDPRAFLRPAEKSMANRVAAACRQLGSAGRGLLAATWPGHVRA